MHRCSISICKPSSNSAGGMVRDGRASELASVHLQGLNVKTDRRHDRRARSPDEMRWLLDVTAKAPERYGMTGCGGRCSIAWQWNPACERQSWRSLTRASFNLEGHEPSVTIAAAYAKNRRQDVLPLRPDFVRTTREASWQERCPVHRRSPCRASDAAIRSLVGRHG